MTQKYVAHHGCSIDAQDLNKSSLIVHPCSVTFICTSLCTLVEYVRVEERRSDVGTRTQTPELTRMTGRDSELRRDSFLRVSDRCPAVDRRSIRNSSDPGEIVDFNPLLISSSLPPSTSLSRRMHRI